MKVYFNDRIDPKQYERLKSKYELVDNYDHPEELVGILVRQASVPGDVIRKAKNLKIISMHGVGLDRIDVETAKECDVAVTNAPGGSAQSVAELAVSFIMALSRKHKYVNKGLIEGKFEKFGLEVLMGNEVYGKKLGLIGSGNIAQRTAQIMTSAFAAKVYCYNPLATKEELAQLGYEKVEDVKELFKICDFVSIHVPLVESTKNLINADVFETANPDICLVNTARGGIVDEDALYDALTTGKIKAAASDVFAAEPPDKDTPLLKLNNFIGTLHVGGSTTEGRARVSKIAVDNLIAGIEADNGYENDGELHSYG